MGSSTPPSDPLSGPRRRVAPRDAASSDVRPPADVTPRAAAARRMLALQHRFVALLADGYSTSEVAESMLRDLLADLGWRHGSLAYADADTGTFQVLAACGEPEVRDVPQGLTDGVFAEVLQTGRPYQAELEDVAHLPAAWSQATGSGVVVPIFVGNEVAGVLELRAGRTDPLDDEALDDLQAMAASFGPLILRASSPFGDGRTSTQVLRSQKLESLGALAGGVAHDFNNLLGVILGYVELATMGLTRPGASSRRHLDAALSTLSRARSLADLLLGFSADHPDSSDLCDANEVVQHVRDLLAETLDRRIQFDVRLAKDVPVSPLGTPDLRHLLINLCVNAAQAMPEGGLLGVETLVRIVSTGEEDQMPAGRYVGIRVRDTGHGIPDDLLANIFQPGFTTRGDAGTGLGLWVVRTLAARVGGRVEVEASRRGTCLTAWLPSELIVPSRRYAEHADRAIVGPVDVLIVDDEAGVRDVTREFLELDGYTVRVAGTGAEAVELLAREGEEYTVILLDNHLPDLRGIDLLEPIRALAYTPRVVMVTGMPGAPELQDLPDDVALLVKPYLQRHLAAVFQELGIRPRSAR